MNIDFIVSVFSECVAMQVYCHRNNNLTSYHGAALCRRLGIRVSSFSVADGAGAQSHPNEFGIDLPFHSNPYQRYSFS